MDSRPDRFTGLLIGIACTALGAIGWYFGSGLKPLWWATWLAPLPLLWLAPRTRARWAALAALTALALGSLNQWNYLHGLLALPLPVILFALFGPASLFALAVLLFRAYVLRGQSFAAAWSVPVIMTAGAFLNALLSPHGTFGLIGYTQMDALPVIQIAALAGPYAIGFVVWLLPATVAAMSFALPARRQSLRVGAVTAAVLVATLGYGAWRLQAATGPATTIRVGLLAVDGEIRADLATPEGARLLMRYKSEIERLADAGARIVVLPETVFVSNKLDNATLVELSQRRGIRIVVGVDYRGDAQGERNMAVAYGDGKAPRSYIKQHLIPGFEDRYRAGSGTTLLSGEPRTGLVVCKDMDFTATGRDYALQSTQLLLVPAWDFNADGWLHARMAVLRGVEGGFAIARSARDGQLTLSDDRGRVILETPSKSATGVASAIGDLRLRTTRTWYPRHGDWFGWLTVVVAIALLAGLMRRSRVA